MPWLFQARFVSAIDLAMQAESISITKVARGIGAQVRAGVMVAVGSDRSPASLLQPLFISQHTRLAGTQPFWLAQHPLCGALLLPQPPRGRLSWSRFTMQSIIEPNSRVSFIWSYKFQEKAGPMVSALVQH